MGQRNDSSGNKNEKGRGSGKAKRNYPLSLSP